MSELKESSHSCLTPGVEVLVTDWFRRSRESQQTHYACARRCSHFNYLLGVPAIIFSAIVGTAVFASLNEQNTPAWIKILVGLTSILAAVLASLQTFLGYSELAETHRIVGAEYGAIRRTLELLKTVPPDDPRELKKSLETVKLEMDRLAKDAPQVPAAIKSKIDRELKSRDHKRIFDLPGNRLTADTDHKG